MVTREQYIARCDQELAEARDELSRYLKAYAENMEHSKTCPSCDEVDNIASLVKSLVTNEDTPRVKTTACLFAVAVKTIHDLQSELRKTVGA